MEVAHSDHREHEVYDTHKSTAIRQLVEILPETLELRSWVVEYLGSRTTQQETGPELAISLSERSTPTVSKKDGELPGIFTILGQSHMARYEMNGRLGDLEKAIRCRMQGVAMTPDTYAVKPNLLSDLGVSYVSRFQYRGRLEDINQAIGFFARVIVLTTNNHRNRAGWLSNLGLSYSKRFEYLGELDDINQAIGHQIQAVLLTPDDHKAKAMFLGNLGTSHMRRFRCLGDLDDLNQGIRFQVEAVLLTPDGHTCKPTRMNNLGNSHARRFERLGELEDIEQAIEYQTKAVSLTPIGHPTKAMLLDSLGVSHLRRFQRLGYLKDIGQAIEYQTQAVSLTPDGHAAKPMRVNNLGNSHARWFGHMGELRDIDQAILHQKLAIFLTPDGHMEKSGWLSNLGLSWTQRFERLGELDDINQAIDCHSKAVLFTAHDHANKAMYLSNLGSSYMRRFERLGELEDIDHAISHDSEAISLITEDHAYRPMSLNGLGLSYVARFKYLGELGDIDRAIEFHGQALLFTPEGHAEKPMMLSNLGLSHRSRFDRLGELENIDEAIKYHMQAVLLTPDEHARKPMWINGLGASYRSRFERLGELGDIDQAVVHQTKGLLLTPDGDVHKIHWLNNLGLSHESRFKSLGKLHDLNQAIECYAKAVSLTPDGHVDNAMILNNLGTSHLNLFERLGTLDPVNQAVQYTSQSVLLTPEGHANRPMFLNSLGVSCMSRFKHLNEPLDVEHAIKHFTLAVLLTPESYVNRSWYLKNLGHSYRTRFDHLGDPTDIRKCIDYLQQSGQSPVGNPMVKLQSSIQWARLSDQHSFSSPLDAYGHMMGLVPEVVWIGITTRRRYEHIKSSVEGLAAEAASVAVLHHAYDKAIEWLEEGRSIVWNQLVQLRTPIVALSIADPLLAKNIQNVSHQLDYLSSQNVEQVSLLQHVQSLEQAAQQHRRLAKQWKELLEKVRAIPDFSTFLLPKPFSALVASAQSCAIVIVTVSSARSSCNALALLPGSVGCKHIELPQLHYQKAKDLQIKFMSSIHGRRVYSRTDRRPIYSSLQAQDVINEVLETLWGDLVRPVLNGLGYLEPPVGNGEIPQITWCTNGPLAFLPLHAAGCYEEPGDRVSDYVVSSYTPTLSLLLRPAPKLTDFQGILVVGQANTCGSAPLPGTVAEISDIQSSTLWKSCTRLEGDNATAEAVLTAMKAHSWVHLACHASQSRVDPLLSAFKLHKGDLSLADVIKKPLKHADFAFLSACETATGDEMLPDEAVHLAAGMLMAGYSGVVATMWSIHDEDAPLVAKELYGYMLANGAPDGRRAARGLHIAVAKLRDEIGNKEFTRWVPYIHMGH